MLLLDGVPVGQSAQRYGSVDVRSVEVTVVTDASAYVFEGGYPTSDTDPAGL